MFKVLGECLESGSLLGALLDLRGLFVLEEKIDGARWGGFPGSSRLKQNSRRRGSCADDMRSRDYRESRLLLCCDKKCGLLRKFESVDIVIRHPRGNSSPAFSLLCDFLSPFTVRGR